MGRDAKPHIDIHIRYEENMLERLDEYVRLRNIELQEMHKKKTNRTNEIEDIVDRYVQVELERLHKKYKKRGL